MQQFCAHITLGAFMQAQASALETVNQLNEMMGAWLPAWVGKRYDQVSLFDLTLPQPHESESKYLAKCSQDGMGRYLATVLCPMLDPFSMLCEADLDGIMCTSVMQRLLHARK